MKRKYLVPCTLKNLVYVCALQLSEDFKTDESCLFKILQN